jgi:transcriptional regulator with XRE-family HTH domain
MSSSKTPAQMFKDARLKKGLTQAVLANKAGINPNTYAKIERGEQEPSISTVKKLAKALDLDLAAILKVWS